MIQEFVNGLIERREAVESEFHKKHPDSYKDIVKIVIENISTGGYSYPDPARIHEIDDGDYQGTLLYIIAAIGYQPNDYWFVKVYYGSCSVCDTLQGISDYRSKLPTDEQVADYWKLALDVCEGLTSMQVDRGSL